MGELFVVKIRRDFARLRNNIQYSRITDFRKQLLYLSKDSTTLEALTNINALSIKFIAYQDLTVQLLNDLRTLRRKMETIIDSRRSELFKDSAFFKLKLNEKKAKIESSLQKEYALFKDIDAEYDNLKDLVKLSYEVSSSFRTIISTIRHIYERESGPAK